MKGDVGGEGALHRCAAPGKVAPPENLMPGCPCGWGVFLFLTCYLQAVKGYTPLTTGLLFLPLVGCLMVGSAPKGGGPPPTLTRGNLY
jgi:hypothetical protein